MLAKWKDEVRAGKSRTAWKVKCLENQERQVNNRTK